MAMQENQKSSIAYKQEVQSFVPEITSLTFSKTKAYSKNDSTNVSLVIVSSERQLRRSDKEKINKWLANRIRADSVKVLFVD